jgi:hypothetical protein
MKKEVGKKPAEDFNKVESYPSGNATNSGTRIGTKATGVYSASGATVPQNENPHPKEFGVGASKGRGIFNGS